MCNPYLKAEENPGIPPPLFYEKSHNHLFDTLLRPHPPLNKGREGTTMSNPRKEYFCVFFGDNCPIFPGIQINYKVVKFV